MAYNSYDEIDPKKMAEDLVSALRENGAEGTIVFRYDGYGDEGNIDDVEGIEMDLYKKKEISDPVWGIIERYHGGFENNDGGGGTITVDVMEGKVVHSGYDNVINQEYMADNVLSGEDPQKEPGF